MACMPFMLGQGRLYINSWSLTLFVKLTGLKVVEVAHDIQLQVAHYVTKDLKLINSYDTWHGKQYK